MRYTRAGAWWNAEVPGPRRDSRGMLGGPSAGSSSQDPPAAAEGVTKALRRAEECRSRPVSRVLFRGKPRGGEHSSRTHVAVRLQRAIPGGLGGPVASLFALAPGGVCRAAPVTRRAVRSYRTVSPLPRAPGRRRSAVCSLWHFPAGRPDRPLAGTLPCGARTFLGGPRPCRTDAFARAAPARRRCNTRGRRGNGRRPNDQRAGAVATSPEAPMSGVNVSVVRVSDPAGRRVVKSARIAAGALASVLRILGDNVLRDRHRVGRRAAARQHGVLLRVAGARALLHVAPWLSPLPQPRGPPGRGARGVLFVSALGRTRLRPAALRDVPPRDRPPGGGGRAAVPGAIPALRVRMMAGRGAASRTSTGSTDSSRGG